MQPSLFLNKANINEKSGNLFAILLRALNNSINIDLYDRINNFVFLQSIRFIDSLIYIYKCFINTVINNLIIYITKKKIYTRYVRKICYSDFNLCKFQVLG